MTLKKTTALFLKMNKPCPTKRKNKAVTISYTKIDVVASRRSALRFHSLPSSLSQLPTSSNSNINISSSVFGLPRSNSNNNNTTFAGVDFSEPTLDQCLERLNKTANTSDEERSTAVITASSSVGSLATTSTSSLSTLSTTHSNNNNRNVRFEVSENVTAPSSSQVNNNNNNNNNNMNNNKKRRSFARRNSVVVRDLAQQAQIAEQTSIATGIWEL